MVGSKLSLREKITQPISRFLSKRFNPDQASLDAGIKHLTIYGLLSDRMTAIREMAIDENIESEVDKFIGWSAQTWESAIPYLRAKDDQYLLRKIKAYLENYNTFLYYKKRYEERAMERDVILNTMKESVNQLLLENKIDDVTAKTVLNVIEYVPNNNSEENQAKFRLLEKVLPSEVWGKLNTWIVDELQYALGVMRLRMLKASKFLVAISFGDMDIGGEPKTIVISKPEIQPLARQQPQRISAESIDTIRRTTIEAIQRQKGEE